MESYQHKVNLTAPTLTFPGTKEEKLLTITSNPIIGLIYENNKKEKRTQNLNKDDAEHVMFYEEYIQERLRHRTNRGKAGKGSLNVAHGSSSKTYIIEKIDKLERRFLDGKLMFVDDHGNLLYKVVHMGNVDSDSAVEMVFDEPQN
ncbi:hypothetical protein Tco_0571326 [Tanacetum coccineum]